MTATGDDERKSISKRAGIVAGGTLFSRLLGLVREQVLAACFSRAATDVFFVAFLIPNVLRQLLAEGATQNAVLPVLSGILEREGEARAQAAYAAIRGILLLILAAVSLAGVLFAPELVALFAGGFRDTPGKLERTVYVTRWVFPYIFFMGNAALGMAALNTHKRFVVVSFAPALLNVAFIAAALGLPSLLVTMGQDPLLALALGVLGGGLLQMVAQWPSLRRIGYLTRPRLAPRDPAVRDVLRRMTPALLGFGVYYLDVVVARHLLSTMGEGAPSYFTFAQRLCDFPQGIFVMAVQTATLPSLAAMAARGDRSGVMDTFTHGMRLALFAAIPASVALLVLAEPIVSLVFQRGQFGAADTTQTAQALIAQALGIGLVAAVRQTVVVFYALGDTRSPALIAGLDFVAFTAAALVLKGPLGHVGIGWAVTFSSLVQLALLLFRLRRIGGPLPGRELFGSIARTGGASLLAAAPAWWLVGLTSGPGSSGTLAGLLGAATFGLAFFGCARLLGCEELRQLTPALRGVLRRLRGSR